MLSELGAQAHQIAEAALFSPKQYWRASALLSSLLLGLPGDSTTFTATAMAFRFDPHLRVLRFLMLSVPSNKKWFELPTTVDAGSRNEDGLLLQTLAVAVTVKLSALRVQDCNFAPAPIETTGYENAVRVSRFFLCCMSSDLPIMTGR